MEWACIALAPHVSVATPHPVPTSYYHLCHCHCRCYFCRDTAKTSRTATALVDAGDERDCSRTALSPRFPRHIDAERVRTVSFDKQSGTIGPSRRGMLLPWREMLV